MMRVFLRCLHTNAQTTKPQAWHLIASVLACEGSKGVVKVDSFTCALSQAICYLLFVAFVLS